MAETMYEVTAEKYTGKHRVYKKGVQIPESEIFGDLKTALDGKKIKAIGAKKPGKAE